MTPHAAAIADFEASLSEFDVAALRTALRTHRDASGPQLVLLVRHASPTDGFRDATRLMEATLAALSETTTATQFLAMLEVAAAARHRSDISVEPVWTGAGDDERGIRRTASVARALIDEARRELLLVSFSAYPIGGFNEALEAAARRGVGVRMVLETVADSGGRLSIDAATTFRRLAGVASFLHWPLAQRGDGGVLHAKLLVADRQAALVTSANLTEHAHERNIEVGLLVRGGGVAASLCATVERMTAQGFLRPWSFT